MKGRCQLCGKTTMLRFFGVFLCRECYLFVKYDPEAFKRFLFL
jgi:hypothetical protein